MKFRFDNIHLPDSLSNEPQSHGYFIYEVQQFPNLTQATQIRNTAYIYFDFNPPIVTNTVLNTIDLSIGIPEIQKPSISVFPNPVSNELTLSVGNIPVDSKYQILNILGEEEATGKLSGKTTKVNTSGFKAGIYVMRVGGSAVKFVVGR